MINFIEGDVLKVLPTIDANRFRCCCTSPPYFGLRDYGNAAQIGHEKTPEEFIEKMVRVFSEVRRTLTEDGTLWLNLGDSYSATGKSGVGSQGEKWAEMGADTVGPRGGKWSPAPEGFKPKNLLGIPWRVAFALQSDGWYLRSALPWIKRNCMPESVSDRPTSAVEYVFLFAKSDKYFFDPSGMTRPATSSTEARVSQDVENQLGTERANGGAKTNGNMKAVCGRKNEASGDRRKIGFNDRWDDKDRAANDKSATRDGSQIPTNMTRNGRNSDWFFDSFQGLYAEEDALAFVVNPKPFRDAHFAVWPEKLVEPMILSGSAPGDEVLDPFGGSGTTGRVAIENGRRATLIELNPSYLKIARQRCETTVGFGL